MTCFDSVFRNGNKIRVKKHMLLYFFSSFSIYSSLYLSTYLSISNTYKHMQTKKFSLHKTVTHLPPLHLHLFTYPGNKLICPTSTPIYPLLPTHQPIYPAQNTHIHTRIHSLFRAQETHPPIYLLSSSSPTTLTSIHFPSSIPDERLPSSATILTPQQITPQERHA